MRPNQSTSAWGDRFRINNAGLRGTDIALPKPQGVFRLVFLGESITYGGGHIPEHDLFVNRAAASLASSQHRQIEAVNLSAPAWGIQNQAGYVETKGVLDADALVWVISTVDFRRPKTAMEDSGFPDSKPYIRLFHVAHTAWQIARVWSNPAPHVDAISQNLRKFHDLLGYFKISNVPLTVVIVPSAAQYQELVENLNKFRSTAESLSVPFVDLGPALQRYRFDDLFYDGVHLSSRGHEVVADAIVTLLQQNVFHEQAAKHNSP
jgi:hypothetical protein